MVRLLWGPTLILSPFNVQAKFSKMIKMMKLKKRKSMTTTPSTSNNNPHPNPQTTVMISPTAS
jgi:ribosomal protein L30/L7E